MRPSSSIVVHILCVGLLACSVPREGEVRLPDADAPRDGAEGEPAPAPRVPAPPDTPAATRGALTVVSITPEEGQAVLEGTPIVITFSEPMDVASAQAAFTPEIAPAQPPLFSWSADKRVLTVDPGLSYPAGTDPAEVRPLTYAFTIATTARSLAQEALPRPSSRSFTLGFRRIHTTHHFVQKTPSAVLMSGNLSRSTTVPGLWLQLGTPAGVVTQSFLTVPIDTLPEDIEIEAAVLHSELEVVVGEPFRKLGNLRVKETAFNAVVPSLWQSLPIPEPTAILFPSTTPAMVGAKGSADVTGAVRTDYANRIRGNNRSQYRLFFDGSPSAGATNESVRLLRERTFVEITYLIR